MMKAEGAIFGGKIQIPLSELLEDNAVGEPLSTDPYSFQNSITLKLI